MNSLTDNQIEKILRLCQQGDAQAFRQLYDRLGSKIFAFLVARLPQRADALDLLQEVFIDLWQGLNRFSYRSDKEFYAFVFKIAKRKVAKFYSSRKIAVEFSEYYARDNYDNPIGNILGLARVVNKLKRGYRDVIHLRYWAQMSFAEIADHLNIKESAAKVRHHRALKKLQTLAQDYEK